MQVLLTPYSCFASKDSVIIFPPQTTAKHADRQSVCLVCVRPWIQALVLQRTMKPLKYFEKRIYLWAWHVAICLYSEHLGSNSKRTISHSPSQAAWRDPASKYKYSGVGQGRGWEDWRVGSVVKTTYCSCRGPKFSSQHLHDSSQL